jgi:hypothetical protein
MSFMDVQSPNDILELKKVYTHGVALGSINALDFQFSML